MSGAHHRLLGFSIGTHECLSLQKSQLWLPLYHRCRLGPRLATQHPSRLQHLRCLAYSYRLQGVWRSSFPRPSLCSLLSLCLCTCRAGVIYRDLSPFWGVAVEGLGQAALSGHDLRLSNHWRTLRPVWLCSFPRACRQSGCGPHSRSPSTLSFHFHPYS